MLFVRLYAGSDAPRKGAQKKADWLLQSFAISEGARLLDLGCGSGLLDVCLSKEGIEVTAVDKLTAVIEHARSQPGGEEVEFVVGDVRELSFPAGFFDCILLWETAGLMSKEDDARLLVAASEWLKPSGRLLVDCQKAPSEPQGRHEWQLGDETLALEWKYDERHRRLHIVPGLRTASDDVIELYDPYDPSKGDECGVIRYLYPESELGELIRRAGLQVSTHEHYASREHYLLVGEHN